MSKKPQPKHRRAKHRAPGRAVLPVDPAKALRTTVVMTSVAAATTGAVVGGGVLSGSVADEAGAAQLASGSVADTAAAQADGSAARVDELVADRGGETTSRSDSRAETDPTKVVALSTESGPALAASEDASDLDPRDVGRMLLTEFGFGQDQWSCLDSLWTKESNWQVDADNPTSSAYGIPQSLPGSKMASAGDDWETNPVTQIRWGLGYIEDRYGTPCSAWAHSQANNWY
ncbi:lytic transglycosylase domain-containing protein [Nocardioides zeae]|uniref:Lytic transglycosylase domain-containing protein n=1 Tax=Nocardioides imazamoxiresistens TaxID=3231893 RepID=A0ABU3PYV4_9ACTN|nr:lytic transglycosylase domain-containing protein [Nocardioides zeae]MDT9594438.1 lytic transglycosylase domain-containing protein [Nocardioides zeae]